MEQDNILNKMAGFDFSAPIKVTIIFEDSDDDSNLCQTIVGDESSRTNTDQVIPAELATGTIKQGSQYFEIALHNQIIVAEDKGTKEDVNNLNDVNNNSQINVPLIRESRIRKRKLREPEVVDNVKTINDKYNKQNYVNQQNNSKMQTNHTQNSIQTNKNEKQNNTSQEINQHEQVPNNGNSLLDNLSANLILIMDSYYQMEKQLRSIEDKNIRKKSQDAFLYVRRYFLDLSYETIDALIVPQENNSKFINSFLDKTVRMAIDKKGIKCDRRHVYTFYKYMVQWTKQQKKLKNTLHQQNYLLKQYLNKPPMHFHPPHGNVPKANHYNLDNPCIFLSGPPGREISINVNKAALNDVNASYAFQTTCSSKQNLNEYCNNVTPVSRTAVTYTHNNSELHGYNQPPRQAVSRKEQSTLNSLPQAVYHPPVSRAPPPQYSMRQQNHFQNTNYYPQPTGTLVPTKNHVDMTRTTESSESGYVSPSSGSPSVTAMDGVPNQEQTLFTPMISNIVSQSPHFHYTTMHGCHLCARVTEFRCRGCYTYYCSNICEQLDSQFHKAFCRRT